MFARRRGSAAPEAVRRAFAGFRSVAERLEEAKGTLLLGVPSGRRPRLALADALTGFEEGLRRALAEMDSWHVPDVEAEWVACRAALGETSARADRLRLASTDAYEELVPLIDDLLEPLESFADAASRFEALGA